MLWLWNFFLERRQFSYVLITVLVIAGAYSLLQIPKENSPAIVIPDGIVTTALPGASSEDVETLITDKLENQISGLANIDTVTSDSREGFSQITVQFTANADINQSIDDLRNAVASAQPNLPSDATTPQVTKIDLSKQPIIVAALSGDLPPTEFSNLGRKVQIDLQNVPGVSEVDVAGVPPREVDVIVNKQDLQLYNLSLPGIISAVSASNAAAPAGDISMDGVNYTVAFQGGITDPSQINDIAVGQHNGAVIYLRNVATISDGLAPDSTYSRLSLNGKPSSQAITFTIYKQSSATVQGTADAVKAELSKLQRTTLKGLSILVPPATDQGAQVGKQLGNLAETGMETVALVMFMLLLTIGWRESLIAAFAIPLSFLIAFIGLYLSGNTLNFISLFSLILAIGILVDSGIVVTEAINARMRIFDDKMQAAQAALRDYAWPLIAGTMATVAVFAPLFFITGIIGKFIAGIPFTLIFVLLASIFVALGIIPLIAVLFTKKHQNRLEATQEKYTERLTNWYKMKLRTLLENRRAQNRFLIALVALLILSLALPFSGLVQSTFFPQADEDFIYVNIEKPEGTTLQETDLAAREVEEVLYNDPYVASFETTVGQSSSLSSAGSAGSNQANITVNLPNTRTMDSMHIAADLQNRLAPVTDANVQVLQASNGPPSGAPIQIQFEGQNLSDLITAADKGRQLLSTIPGAINITSSTQNNGTEFDLTIDRAKAAAFGLNTQMIAQTLNTAISGTKATTITEPNQNIDVIVKLNLNAGYSNPSQLNQTTLDSIMNLTVQGSSGPVFLGSVLNSNLGISSADIAHNDGNRIETVSAYPSSKTTTSAVVAAFQKALPSISLPSGVSVSYGGDTKNINQSFEQMFVALIAGLALMFMILIIAFNSIRYTLYLLSIVPLSLIGVLDGLALTGQPISFTSLLGIIALGGVIINHAIILMDSMIKHLRAEPHKPIIDVVVESAATRIRPITLTTITTVIGMVPLVLSNTTWGPLAYSVMFGLTFAICLTLILVPLLFFRAPHNTDM